MKCTKCLIEKPLDQFWADRSKAHGKSARCKVCKTADYTCYRKQNGYDKKRYDKNPLGERERHLVRKYGIDLNGYGRLFKIQNGSCAICGRKQGRAFDVIIAIPVALSGVYFARIVIEWSAMRETPLMCCERQQGIWRNPDYPASRRDVRKGVYGVLGYA